MNWEIFFGIVGIIGLIAAYYFWFRQKPKIVIEHVYPAMSGSASGVYTYQITSIEVYIKNTGYSKIDNCEALILFPALHALPLFYGDKGRIDYSNRKFSINPRESVALYGSFVRNTPGRYGGGQEIEKTDFVRNALPLKVSISFGDKTIEKEFSKEIITHLNNMEKDYYKSN